MRQLHRGQRDIHHVVLVGERLDHHPVRLQLVGEQALLQRGAGQLQPARPQVGDGGHLLHGDPLPGDPLDRLEQAVLPRLGQGDRHALAAGPADPADPVHVRVRIGRHVVVDDVGELLDVQPSGGHVGGDEQVRGARPQPAHHPLALFLAHPAVHRFGPVTAAVERLGQLVDLFPGTAEHDRRGGRLHVQHPPQRRRLVRPGDHVRALPHQRRLARGRNRPTHFDGDRVAQMPAGDPVDARRHGRGEQHRLPVLRRRLEDRLDVLGEPHVEHLVRLVQHHRAHSAELEGLASDVVQRAAGGGDHHVHPAVERLQLPADGLAAVDGQNAHAEVPAVPMERLRDLHGQLAGGHQDQRRRLRVPPVGRRQPLQHRQGERRRLAGPGRGLTEQVVPAQQGRYRRPLDRRRLLVPQIGERAQQLRRQCQVGETVGLLRCFHTHRAHPRPRTAGSLGFPG